MNPMKKVLIKTANDYQGLTAGYYLYIAHAIALSIIPEPSGILESSLFLLLGGIYILKIKEYY